VSVSEDGKALERRAQAAATAAAPVTATPSLTVPPAAVPPRLRPAFYVAALLLLAVMGLTWLSFNRQRDSSYVPGAEGNPATVVAVLPFSNLSANPDNAVLAPPISNEVINLLGPIAPDRLGVIASTSTAHYVKGRDHKADRAGTRCQLRVGRLHQPAGPDLSRLGTADPRADQSYVWGDEYDLDGSYSGSAYRQLVIHIATQVAALLARMPR